MAQAVLKPMGPCFDMTVRRTQWAPIELAKQALRRPKSAHYKPKSVKCVHNPLPRDLLACPARFATRARARARARAHARAARPPARAPCLTAQPPRAQERAAGWRGRSDRSPPSRVPRPQQAGTPEVQKLQRGGESGGGRGGGGGGRCCRGGMSGGATGGEQRPSLFSFRVRISASDFADFAHLDLDLCVSIRKQHI